MRITSKVAMRALYNCGAFGNKLPSWTWEQFSDGGVPLPIGLMYNGKPGIRLPRYAEPLETLSDVLQVIDDWKCMGCDQRLITFSVSDHQANFGRLFQGEVVRDEQYLSLRYTTVDDIMRKALNISSRNVQMLEALLFLEYYLDTVSMDNMRRLWDEYPGHIVEFSTYNRPVGMLNSNTVFWEVRYY